jgi:IS5 family transposase
VPDAKTLWRYRESLKSAVVFDRLFAELARQIAAEGYVARKGQIIDASLVAAPIQRNRRTENAQIKAGEVPADWPEAKRRQKDVEARWTQKHGVSHYGYKNHVSVDREKKADPPLAGQRRGAARQPGVRGPARSGQHQRRRLGGQRLPLERSGSGAAG